MFLLVMEEAIGTEFDNLALFNKMLEDFFFDSLNYYPVTMQL